MKRDGNTNGGKAGAEGCLWSAPPARLGSLLGYGTKVATSTEPCISSTTFNILAPIYKRLDKEDQSRRESQYKAYWLARNQKILDRLLSEMSSIICLQEVWVGNDELVGMYESRLGEAGYMNFKLARTDNRGDDCYVYQHQLYKKVEKWKLEPGLVVTGISTRDEIYELLARVH